jgi:hypothetical protein
MKSLFFITHHASRITHHASRITHHALLMLLLMMFSGVSAQNCGPLTFGSITTLANGNYAVDVFLNETLVLDDVYIEVEFPPFSSVIIDYAQTTTHPGINANGTSTATQIDLVGSPATALQNGFLANIVFSLPFGNCLSGIDFGQANYFTLPNGGCGMVSRVNLTNQFCTPQRMIGGLLETPINGYTITGADVEVVTETFTIYNFLNLANAYYDVTVPTSNLEVTADRQQYWACGVTTYDFLAIRRHLLGSAPFTEMAQHIAGDVNNDRRVTTIDMILLQQYLQYNQNPENLFHANWVFIPTAIYNNLSFPPVFSPPIPLYGESYAVPAGTNDVYGLGFYGIKIGDINETCILDEARSEEIVTYGEETFFIPSLDLKEGEEVAIPFTNEDFGNEDVLSIQLSIDTEQVEIVEVYSSQLPFFDEEAIHISRDQQQIEILWFPRTAEDFVFDADKPVFYVKVRAKKEVRSTFDLITLGAGFENVSMTKRGKIQSVKLALNDKALPSFMEVGLFPNPFTSYLEVNIDSPVQQRGLQQLVNVKGETVFEEPLLLLPGSNRLEITPATSLPAGLYFHRILTPDSTIISKLIKH